MKNLFLAPAFLISLAFVSANAQSRGPKDNSQTAEGKEVLATVAKWANAVKNRDLKELDALFADELIVTTSDGKTRGKTEELEILKPNENVRTVSIKNEDVKVRVFGKAAVVTALTKMHFVISEKDAHSAFRYTAVFVKENDRWRLAALQTARVSQEASTTK